MTEAHGQSAPVGARGFTLVELLVALALLALMSTLLLAALHGGRRVLDAAERQQSELPVDAAQALLRELLSGARPVNARPNAAAQALPTFSGASDQVVFTTLLDKRGQYGGLYEATIMLGPSSHEASRALILDLRLQRRGADAAAAGEQTRHVLLEGVRDLKLAYYGRLGDDAAPRWHEEWRDRQRLPSLITVRSSFSEGSTRRFPDMLVGLPLAMVD